MVLNKLVNLLNDPIHVYNLWVHSKLNVQHIHDRGAINLFVLNEFMSTSRLKSSKSTGQSSCTSSIRLGLKMVAAAPLILAGVTRWLLKLKNKNSLLDHCKASWASLNKSWHLINYNYNNFYTLNAIYWSTTIRMDMTSSFFFSIQMAFRPQIPSLFYVRPLNNIYIICIHWYIYIYII